MSEMSTVTVGARAVGRTRVLHVITWMDLGGAQDHLLRLVEGTDRRKYEVAVATGTSAGDRGGLFAALSDVVRVEPLTHLRRELAPRDDPRSVAEIGRLMDRWQPDIVHTHSSKAGIAGRVAAIRRPVRTVHNVHGWSFRAATNPVTRLAAVRLERLLGARTDFLLNVSDADRQLGDELGIRARVATEVVRGGIDLERFSRVRAGRERFEPHRRTVVGTVGRLVPAKDPITAIRAMRAVIDERADVVFRWVGDGPLLTVVEQEVKRLGLVDNVELVGLRHDIPRELQEFDVFLLSSRFEGLPRTLMEATAAGVPVVATSVGGVAELIEDGRTGMLVRPNDPMGLARAVLSAVSDPSSALDRAEAAIGAAQAYSTVEMCRRTELVYQRLVT